MPLQNRVSPFGEVVALPGRGTLMGNRGILHNEQRRIVRQSAVKRWIACVLDFRGRHREVMTPHRYTELFFLDEAAAFSAGHRPCAECRREDFNRFQNLWYRTIGGPKNADSMDAVLHRERLDGKKKRTYSDDLATLPDGTYVVFAEKPHLLWGASLHEWSDAQYTKRRKRPASQIVEVLTPPSMVKLFSAGYASAVHRSATA